MGPTLPCSHVEELRRSASAKDKDTSTVDELRARAARLEEQIGQVGRPCSQNRRFLSCWMVSSARRNAVLTAVLVHLSFQLTAQHVLLPTTTNPGTGGGGWAARPAGGLQGG